MEKALQREPFGKLDAYERGLLLQKWQEVRGGAPIFTVTLAGIRAFKQVRWARSDLAGVYVIPWFARDVVSQDLASAVRLTFKQWIEAEPVKPLHQGHARYAAMGAPRPSMQDNPLPVGRYPEEGLLVLLDGYHRSVRYWSSNDPAVRLPVFVPTEQT